jgi:predicted nucleic acid-binding protein
MGVVVFDSDVLIGFLNRDDVHHHDAVTWMQDAMAAGTRRLVCAVNYAEILIGPLRIGAQARVKQMLVQFNIETISVDAALAERAAAVRARTDLKLPDAFALATAIHAEHRGLPEVRLASFDKSVLKAHAALHPARKDPDGERP